MRFKVEEVIGNRRELLGTIDADDKQHAQTRAANWFEHRAAVGNIVVTEEGAAPAVKRSAKKKVKRRK